MAKAKLARAKQGINKRTWTPIFYVECRINSSRPWAYLTDGKKWLTHRSEAAAAREAKTMQRRLAAKQSSEVSRP